MSDPAVPRGEAGSALLLLAALALVALGGEAAAEDDLAPRCAAVGLLFAALLGPAFSPGSAARWSFLPLVVAVPATVAFAYPCADGFVWRTGLLLLCACLAGAGARLLRGHGTHALYFPVMVLTFAGPYGAGYLAAEFGGLGTQGDWRVLSPIGAAARLAEGGAFPWSACLLLLFWPLLAWTLREWRKA